MSGELEDQMADALRCLDPWLTFMPCYCHDEYAHGQCPPCDARRKAKAVIDKAGRERRGWVPVDGGGK